MAASPKTTRINIPQRQDATEPGQVQDCEHFIESTDLECPVCLQACIHPVQLPCKHIFCFLCVKGAANRSKRCALCRQEISPEFFQKPKLLRQADLEKTVIFDSKYQWFYEGRNGWWQYDDRTSQELEVKFKEGEKVFELLIAGFLYVIDLEEMIQYRRNDRSRKRNMKRDLVTMTGIKGVAGLKYASQVNSSTDRPGGDGLEQQSTVVINPISPTDSANNDDLLAPPAPNNTPQTPQTPADSPPSSTSGSQQDLSSHFHNLTLTDSGQVNRHQHPTGNHTSVHSPSDLSDSDGHTNISTQVAIGHLNVDQMPYIDEQDVNDSFESDSDEEI